MPELLRLSDPHTLFSAVACRSACPVGTDGDALSRAVREGRLRDAYTIVRAGNPFASTCGRVCEAPCEAACVRGNLDHPIPIRALERHACEQYGVESLQGADYSLWCSSAEGTHRPEPNGLQVAIIGAGPSGLACAHDLARLGYACTVFESSQKPGGRMAAVPDFRGAGQITQLEIEAIASLGVNIRPGTRISVGSSERDLLCEGFSAICLALGLYGLPRTEAAQWGAGSHLLMRLPRFDSLLQGISDEDAAGIWAVVPDGPLEDLAALDAARGLVRSGGSPVVCRGEWEWLSPYVRQQAELAREEGCEVHSGCSLQPADDGAVTLCTPEGQVEAGAGRVVAVAGRTAEVPFAGVRRYGSGLVKIDPRTGLTSLERVFAAGSCVIGRLPFIHAVADGQRAARDIHAYLSGTLRPEEFVACLTPVPLTQFDRSRSRPGGRHAPPPVLPARVRQCAGLPAELSYPAEHALNEAHRCLTCHINTIFDASRCNLCGKCVKVCPEDVLTIVRADEAGEGAGVSVAAEVGGSIILKDDSRCSRCGWCAMICPERAISMEALDVSGAPTGSRPGAADTEGD